MASFPPSVVLVVEDDILIRWNARDALADGGFTVLEAEDSAAAILVALRHPRIDLLFTDVNMPGDMDGIDLAEHLFALRPKLKIVVTSGLSLSRDLSGVGGRFLPKPYRVQGLCEMAEAMLAADRPAPQPLPAAA
jgi:CheY-like chemotaxis protein